MDDCAKAIWSIIVSFEGYGRPFELNKLLPKILYIIRCQIPAVIQYTAVPATKSRK